MKYAPRLIALTALSLAACTPVVPIGARDDSGTGDAAPDAPAPDAPPPDAPAPDAPPPDVPAPDAPAPDASVADVPAADRPPVDGGAGSCMRNDDCPRGQVCEFALGCDQTVGECHNDGCHSLPVAPQYCGCDGRTIQQVSACLPDRPYRTRAPCPDAGATPDA